MPVKSSQLAAPLNVESAIKRAQYLRLRAEGYTYERIGAIMGTSKQVAHVMVLKALAETREDFAEAAKDVRSLELVRCDVIYAKLSKLFHSPGNPAPERTAAAMIRVMERRSMYLGLDAPKDVRLGGIPGGDAIPITGDFNLKNLTIEQLKDLAMIVIASSTQAPRAINAPPATARIANTNGNGNGDHP